jgi:transcriptional regulator with XRE-family HTH domain
MLELQELARHFGKNLARIRKRAGVSQEELGFLASLHRTEIGMLERGVRLPRVDTLLKLAGALEVEPGELLEGLGWMPSDPRVGSFRVGGEDVELRP